MHRRYQKLLQQSIKLSRLIVLEKSWKLRASVDRGKETKKKLIAESLVGDFNLGLIRRTVSSSSESKKVQGKGRL